MRADRIAARNETRSLRHKPSDSCGGECEKLGQRRVRGRVTCPRVLKRERVFADSCSFPLAHPLCPLRAALSRTVDMSRGHSSRVPGVSEREV